MNALSGQITKSDYVVLALYSGLLVSFCVLFVLGRDAQAEMSNLFATIRGVLLALYFVVDHPRQRSMITLLLLSILVSLSSSITSLGTPVFQGPFYSPETATLGSRAIFIASAFLFAASTFSFGISAKPRKKS